MIPQILQQLGSNLTVPPQVRQLISLVRSSGNPQAMLAQLMQTNPQMRQVMELIQKHGGDANKAFYALAEEKGINPQEILDLIKGI